MEHRWGERRDLECVVHLRTRSGLAATGILCNLSVSGALIASPLPAGLWSYVQVYVVAEVKGRRLRAVSEGQVVRRTPEGFAIEWCEFAPEAVRVLWWTAAPRTELDQDEPWTITRGMR